MPEQQIVLAEEVMEEWLTTPRAQPFKGNDSKPIVRVQEGAAMLSYMYL